MRKIAISSVVATMVAVAGCGGDSTGPAASVAGTYNLQTVNSAALPFVAQDDATGKLEVLSDQYVLAGDGTYTNASSVRITLPGSPPEVTSFESHGAYTVSGSSVTLTDADDPTDKLSGTIAGTTMTVAASGFVLVYQRSGS